MRLGRLTAIWLIGLFIVLNGILGTVIAFLGESSGTLAIIILAVEFGLIFLIPILFSIIVPLAIIILTVRMWRRESKSVANLILPIIMILFAVVDVVYLRIGHLSQGWLWLQVLAFAYPILTLYLGWQFLIFFLSSWVYGRRMKKFSAKYFVVHGAGLIAGERVGKLLENRIRAAVNVAKADTQLILSGGQGEDEKVSEAAAMQKFAVAELNFPAERTLLEDKSRTTYENLVFSSELIEKLEIEPENRKFMFFSSDYHVFRAALFARQLGLDAQGGSGGKTAFYYRVPAFIREFIAVLNSERRKHILRVGTVVGVLIIAAIFIYFKQH